MSFYLLQQVIDSNIPEACSALCQLVSMGDAIIISLQLTLSNNPDISSLSLSCGSCCARLYCSGNSRMWGACGCVRVRVGVGGWASGSGSE